MSSFDQTMMGSSPRCYIPSFVEIGPLVPEKKNLKVFYHIWVLRPSWSCDRHHVKNFNFLVPKSLHIKFGKKWLSGF